MDKTKIIECNIWWLPTKVEWLNALIGLWHLVDAIKYEYFDFNVFMAALGRSIGECLLMTRLGHLVSLKLKRKSN